MCVFSTAQPLVYIIDWAKIDVIAIFRHVLWNYCFEQVCYEYSIQKIYTRMSPFSVNEDYTVPVFETKLEDQDVKEGDKVMLQCRVTGNPIPDIKWYHGDKVLKNIEDFRQTYVDGVAQLVLQEVLPEDNGSYKCRAKNDAGKAEVSCVVNVDGEYGAWFCLTRDGWFNPLRAKFFKGNINIYLHFMSLLHTNMTQVLKIIPQVRPGPTYST